MDSTKANVVSFGESTERKRFSIRLWLLPVAGSLVTLMSMGSMRCNSLIFVELMKEKDGGRLMASLPFALLGVASITMAPVIGFCGSKISLSYFALMGVFLLFLGEAACFFSTNLYAVTVFIGYFKSCGIVVLVAYVPQVINLVFKENTATAMGMATMGEPLGGYLWPFLFQYFLDNYGLNGAFLLSAGLSLHALVGVLIISNYMSTQHNRELETQNHGAEENDRRVKTLADEEYHSDEDQVGSKRNGIIAIENDPDVKSEDTLEPKNKLKPNKALTNRSDRASQKRILISVITSRPIYILSVTNTLVFLVMYALNQVIVDYMNDKGLGRQSALYLLTIVASGGIIGRLGLGWIIDKNLISSQLHKSLTLLTTASALLTTTYVSNFQILWICYFALGICQASIMVTNWILYSVYYKDEELLMSFAVYRLLSGFVQLFRMPLIGLFRDVYHSYEYLFRALSIVLFLLSALWILEDHLHKKSNKKYSKLPSEDPDET